jgi:hypothetical protein
MLQEARLSLVSSPRDLLNVRIYVLRYSVFLGRWKGSRSVSC